MDFAIRGEWHWAIALRCGDCGRWSELVTTNEAAAMVEVALARDFDEMAAAAQRLDLERMAVQVEAFVTALDRDLIDAADFAVAA